MRTGGGRGVRGTNEDTAYLSQSFNIYIGKLGLFRGDWKREPNQKDEYFLSLNQNVLAQRTTRVKNMVNDTTLKTLRSKRIKKNGLAYQRIGPPANSNRPTLEP